MRLNASAANVTCAIETIMNCREAEELIFAARDGALDEIRRAALAQHLEQCAACRAMQAELEVAAKSWRTADSAVNLPAVEIEWHAIRRRMRGDHPAGGSAAARWLRPRWWSLATATAAVVALAVFVGPRWFQPAPAVAAHDAGYVSYVVVENTSAATMVYEDAESGWLVVWVSDDGGSAGT